jgi:hypothetical protein
MPFEINAIRLGIRQMLNRLSRKHIPDSESDVIDFVCDVEVVNVVEAERGGLG